MADRNGYIGRAPGDSSVVVARQVYTPTTDTTTFTFSSGYTVGYLEVYLNGSKLISGSGNDYVASNGSTVVLNAAAVSGDVVEIVAYKAFNVATIDSAPGNFTVGGDLTVDGSSSATSYSGDGSALTGIVTSITAGANISVSGATGNVTITGLANTSTIVADSLVVQGISTFSGQLNGGAASFSGNVSVGGTLTYEDVTNVDSVGLITARTGIEVSGIVTARAGSAVTYYGDGSQLSGIEVGITTTALSPAANTVVTLNLTTAQHHQLTLSAGITTITCSGGSFGDSHSVVVIQPSSGIATVGFSTFFLFPSGSAPAMSEGSGKTDLISFVVKRVGAGGTQLLASAGLDYQ
jgi:hypothetical protein